jgi:hypothetical protein
MKTIKAAAKRVIPSKSRLCQWLNAVIFNDTFAIEFCAHGPGFFAHLNWCLEILLHCDEKGLKPCFIVTTPYMLRQPGENWFDYFFQLKAPVTKPHPTTIYRVRDICELGFAANLNSRLHFGNAPSLFHKYIGIQSHIVQKCDSFYNAPHGGADCSWSPLSRFR